jgi:hypothetical protein
MSDEGIVDFTVIYDTLFYQSEKRCTKRKLFHMFPEYPAVQKVDGGYMLFRDIESWKTWNRQK